MPDGILSPSISHLTSAASSAIHAGGSSQITAHKTRKSQTTLYPQNKSENIVKISALQHITYENIQITPVEIKKNTPYFIYSLHQRQRQCL